MTGYIKRIMFLCAIFLCAQSAWTQEIVTDIVHDFSESSSDTMRSNIQLVHADTNIIIVAGNILDDTGGVRQAYTAAFDYTGGLLWQRALPQGTMLNLTSPNVHGRKSGGYINLKRLATGSYVVGGSMQDMAIRPGYKIAQPFLYFFNAAGDSLGYHQYDDALQSRYINTLSINAAGNIVAGGVIDSEAYGYTEAADPIYCPLYGLMWLCEFDASGAVLQQKEMGSEVTGLPYGRGLPYFVTHIVPHEGQYTVIVSNPAYRAYMFITINSDFADTYYTRSAINTYVEGIVSALPYPFYSHFVALEKNAPAKEYYFAATSSIDNEEGTGYGLYYGVKSLVDGSQTANHAELLNEDFVPGGLGFPLVDGGISMAVAKNNDLILQKIGASPGGDVWGPGIVRMKGDGDIKWQMLYQHVAAIDVPFTALRQVFNSTSVAPDGRIVLGGYIATDSALSVYDTVGSLSWLVVINDSSNDVTKVNSVSVPKVNINIYPNPADDKAMVQMDPGKITRDMELCLTDITGRQLTTCPVAGSETLLDLKSYSSGMYFITLYHKGKAITHKKLVKTVNR